MSVYLLIEVFKKDNSNAFEWSARTLGSLALFFVYVIALVESVYFLFRTKPVFAKLFLGTFVGIYCFLGFYHFKTDLSFDFAILADHWKFIWRPGSFKESMALANSTFSFPQYFWAGVGVAMACWLSHLDLKKKPETSPWWLAIATLTWAVLVFGMKEPVDEFTQFTQSAVYRALPFKTAFQKKYKPSDSREFPLIHKYEAQHGSKAKPNIFIVFIESFNAHFVENKSPNGKEYTPVYNSWIKKGRYYENFYGQSIQTGRAHFASLCGLTPSVYGKEFSEFVDRNFHCLPQILKDNGYYTVFSKANEDVHFDNTFNFTTKHGYEVMNSMSTGCDKEAPGTCWGWGIRDRLFYQRAFAFLKQSNPGKPIFATMATISSHMPFGDVPREERQLYPDPKNRLEKYSNAIRITDEYLKVFFEELDKSGLKDNSIVIVTGDHSFPMGEHKNFRNESYAFEENFKTPMLLLDFRKKPVIEALRVKEPYSQLNIANTILDLTGISTDVHFIGGSLLGPPPEYIPMLQPYGGIYFAVVKWPYKYVMYDRNGDEYIYNLQNDPGEHLNLRKDWTDQKQLEAFRSEVGRVWFNFDLMTQNRVWPAEKFTAVDAKTKTE